MREGRRRPSLLTLAQDLGFIQDAAMREGRRRPSLQPARIIHRTALRQPQ